MTSQHCKVKSRVPSADARNEGGVYAWTRCQWRSEGVAASSGAAQDSEKAAFKNVG